MINPAVRFPRYQCERDAVHCILVPRALAAQIIFFVSTSNKKVSITKVFFSFFGPIITWRGDLK